MEMARLSMSAGTGLIVGGSGGRGAWICRSDECVNTAKKRRALQRALRTEVPVESFESLRSEIVGSHRFPFAADS